MAYNSKSGDRKSLIKIIMQDGWVPIGQKGGHIQFKHPLKKGKVTIPYHISKNIWKSVHKQAQIRERSKNG